MNGLNSVNLSAAVVLTSTEYAENLGIAKQKWIYMLGGAGTSDASLCRCQMLPSRLEN